MTDEARSAEEVEGADRAHNPRRRSVHFENARFFGGFCSKIQKLNFARFFGGFCKRTPHSQVKFTRFLVVFTIWLRGVPHAKSVILYLIYPVPTGQIFVPAQKLQYL